jgi:hypothetical protein
MNQKIAFAERQGALLSEIHRRVASHRSWPRCISPSSISTGHKQWLRFPTTPGGGATWPAWLIGVDATGRAHFDLATARTARSWNVVTTAGVEGGVLDIVEVTVDLHTATACWAVPAARKPVARLTGGKFRIQRSKSSARMRVRRPRFTARKPVGAVDDDVSANSAIASPSEVRDAFAFTQASATV